MSISGNKSVVRPPLVREFLSNLTSEAAHTFNNSTLSIVAYSSVAATIVYNWELYVNDGTQTEIQRREGPEISQGQNVGTFTTTSDRAASSSSSQLREGFLYALRVSTATSVKRGQCFVVASIVTGAITRTLFADYLTTNQTLTFPGSVVTSPTQGTGVIRSVAGTVGVTTSISWTVPTNARWRVLGINILGTTDATAVTRSPKLQIGTQAVSFALALGASITYQLRYSVYGAEPYQFVDSTGSVWDIQAVPSSSLVATDTINEVLDNQQAADTVTSGTALVEEWIEF